MTKSRRKGSWKECLGRTCLCLAATVILAAVFFISPAEAVFIEEENFASFLEENFVQELLDLLSPLLSWDIPSFQPPEVADLLKETDTWKQSQIVRQMAEKYGPSKTLEILVRSGLPFTGETHLVVHEVGNVAYERFKEKALTECDESFLSACYHGVIINMLGERGFEGVAEMVGHCQDQGVHIFTQCTHASGHGFLAWSDYDMARALALCDELKKYNRDIPEFSCHDGVFMENIFSVHEGELSDKRLVRENDPFYPCNAVPKKYQPGCWANQASLMFQLFNGDLRKVAEHCDLVENSEYKEICYDNFARQIHPMTLGRTEIALSMCQNATSDWKDFCLITLARAAFSVGDREKMPYEICQSMLSGKDQCYEELFRLIDSHSQTKKQQKGFCSQVREEHWRGKCLARFNAEAVASRAPDADTLAKLAKRRGVKAAYDFLKANASNTVAAHDLAHLIGNFANQNLGLNGIKLCDDKFAFGCYHGFFEELIRKDGAGAIKTARASCLALSPWGQAASCLHGIGHGVLALTSNLNAALKLCETFPANERPYCFDGTFMEFYTGIMHTEEKPEIAEDNPWKLCRELKPEYQRECVRNETFFLLSAKNPAFVAKNCETLAPELKQTCVQSIGLFLGKAPGQMLDICRTFSNDDDQSQCITSAAQERVFQNLEGAASLCAGLPVVWQNRCHTTIQQTELFYRK